MTEGQRIEGWRGVFKGEEWRLYLGQAVFEYFGGVFMETVAKCFWASSKRQWGVDLKGKIGIC